MSQFADAKTIAQSYFFDHFKKPDTSAWFPVEYPNHKLKEEPSGTPWARLSYAEGQKIGRDVGMGMSRIPGEMVLQIFLPDDSGTTLARQVADSIVGFMENVDLSVPPNGVIRFRLVSLIPAGQSGAWFMMNVVMPFERDVVNTAAPANPVEVDITPP